MASRRTRLSFNLYLRLLRYVRPYWKIFALSIISMALLGATEPGFPALMKPLFDGTFVQQDPSKRWFIPALIMGLFTLRGVLGYVGDVSVHWVAQRVIKDLRDEMFCKIVALPTVFYDHRTSGELISKLSYDVSQVAEAATRTLTVLVKDLLAATGLICYMLYLNWKLASVIFLIAPFLIVVIGSVSRRLRTLSRNVQDSMGAITSVAQEAIDSHKAVKIFGGQTHETGRFRQATNNMRRFTMKIVTTSSASTPAVQIVVATVLSILTYVAASQSATGDITIGDFISFITAMTLLLSPIRRLTSVNENLQRGLAAAESAFGLIDEPPEPDQGTTVCQRVRGEIQFCNVSLAYPNSTVLALKNVSITIAAGKTIALVGASGSGKSSFVNLIARFYHPMNGRIFLDGLDIEAITLESLRGNIALVSQEVVLFNDTVRSNIAYGALRNVTEAELLRAAEAARVLEFIGKLPDGFSTIIGEDGIRLSGGQRQRIAIARALLKDAPILLLDEATSALDTASERHIQVALESLRQGRTCIVIAHRLTTVENADRIVVFKHGQIVETGTHADLIRRQGVYAKLHRIQFVDDETEPEPLEARAP